MSPRLRQTLARRIADWTTPEAGADAHRALCRSVPGIPLAGDGLTLYVLDAEGGLWVADMDCAVPRAEPVRDASERRDVLRGACKGEVDLAELLPRDDGRAVEAFARLSDDGNVVLRVYADFDASGGEVSVAELYDARTGARLRVLELREPELVPLRVFDARTSILRGHDAEWTLDLEDPSRRLRRATTAIAESPSEDAPGGVSGDPARREVSSAVEPFVGELTSEPSLVAMIGFFYVAGLLPILPGVAVLESAPGAARWQAGVALVGALAVAWGLVVLGLRPRVVRIDRNGTLSISWGRCAALVLAHVRAQDVFVVRSTIERRVALTARGGTRYAAHPRPSRYRIVAELPMRKLDLGSVASEDEAARVVAAVTSWHARQAEAPRS